jgi:hypothetical protein
MTRPDHSRYLAAGPVRLFFQAETRAHISGQAREIPTHWEGPSMRLIKFTTDSDSTPQAGLMDGERVVPLASGPQALSAILHADDFLHKIQAALASSRPRIDLASIQVNAPIDNPIPSNGKWARWSYPLLVSAVESPVRAVAKGQSLLLGYQVTMSGETVWQGLAAILPIFHWTVLGLSA